MLDWENGSFCCILVRSVVQVFAALHQVRIGLLLHAPPKDDWNVFGSLDAYLHVCRGPRCSPQCGGTTTPGASGARRGTRGPFYRSFKAAVDQGKVACDRILLKGPMAAGCSLGASSKHADVARYWALGTSNCGTENCAFGGELFNCAKGNEFSHPWSPLKP